MKVKRFLCLVAAVVVGLSLSAREIKILTVGNSFADSACHFLPAVAKSAGDSVEIVRANIGGCTMNRHWTLVEQCEKDPNLKPYYGKYSLKDRLLAGKWDIVTIQQGSHESWRPECYEPYARNLYDYIKKYAPQAEVVIQQTWAYRADDGRLKSWKITPEEMYEKLSAAYAKVAKELDCRVIPTGFAVDLARKAQPVKDLPPDPETLRNLKRPALPDQTWTLVRGYYWRKDGKGEWRLTLDPSHLSQRGEYLQACVWYGLLFGQPVSRVTFVPKGMTAEDAAFLRGIAQKALDDFRQPAEK